MKWEECESGHDIYLRDYPNICLEWLMKGRKNKIIVKCYGKY